MRTLRHFLTGARWFSIWLVLTVVISVPTAALALHLVLQQPEAAASPIPAIPVPPDWQLQVSLAITSLGALMVPFITYYVRLWAPKLPRIAVPAVAILIGLALSGLSNVVVSSHYPLIQGAAMGVLGTWLREIYSTIKQHQLRA
jgi:hypothetical protein